MKILVLNGSPKGEKSDTMHITRAFLDGMNSVEENEVTTVHVIDSHVGYCKGCFACKRNGGECVRHDDMEALLKAMLASDILLFSFPLYCFGMPAPLKAVIDRTMPLSAMTMQKTADGYEHVAQADYEHLRYVMICGCGFPNSRHNFEAMVLQFRMMFGNGATLLTVAEAPMFNAPEAASVTEPFLRTVRQAGSEYGQNGRIEPETMAKLSVPMIPDDVYAKICNG